MAPKKAVKSLIAANNAPVNDDSNDVPLQAFANRQRKGKAVAGTSSRAEEHVRQDRVGDHQHVHSNQQGNRANPTV